MAIDISLKRSEEREMSTFARRLRKARRSRGLSRERLAEKAGVGVRTLVEWEHGNVRDPQIAKAHTVAEALDVDVLWLLGEEDDDDGIPPRHS